MNWLALNEQMDRILKLTLVLCICVFCVYIFWPSKSRITPECMASKETEQIARYIQITRYPNYDLHTIKISHCMSKAQ